MDGCICTFAQTRIVRPTCRDDKRPGSERTLKNRSRLHAKKRRRFAAPVSPVRSSFITKTVREQRHRSHHKGATGRFELATNGIPFYAIANFDKTSLHALNSWISPQILP